MRLNNFRRNSCRSKSERPDACLSSRKPNRKSWSSRHRYLQYHIDSFSSSVCSPPRQSRMSLCYTSGIPAWLKYLKQVCFHGYIFNVADPIFPKFLKQGCFQAISTLLLIQFKKKKLFWVVYQVNQWIQFIFSCNLFAGLFIPLHRLP